MLPFSVILKTMSASALRVKSMRKSFRLIVTVAAVGLLIPTPRAHAVSKEIIQLQVQVQALQNVVQQLQQQQAAQLGVIQHMLQQNTNTVDKINETMSTLESQVQAQVQAGGGKIDQVSSQMESLNNSVDDLQTRIEKLGHQMSQIQTEMKSMQAAAAAAGASTSAGSAGQPAQGSDTNGQGNTPQALNGQGNGMGSAPGNEAGNGSQASGTAPQGQSTAAATQQGQQSFPPIQQLYQVALSDYNAGRYDLAAGEFADVVKDYPYDQMSGQAQFYVGESYYREQKYKDAIQAYEQVLSQYPGSAKAPASRLHKAYAELALGERSAGIHDLKDLVGRFPQTPEAAQGRLRLNGLLASSSTGEGKPSPYQ